MRGKCLLAAGLCLMLAPDVLAQGPAAGDGGWTTQSKSAPKAAPVPVPAAVPAAAGRETPTAPAGQDPGWSAQDIQLAQARCAALLKGLDVVAVPEPPLREGSDCGAPAPVRLISLGKAPQVAFSPPPTLTCDMVAALHKWLERDVQPLARKVLAAPVVRIETMSSYSCRNAYGRVHGRLSEHARANALDIAAFVTAGGQAAQVMADWGPTQREIAAAAAAAPEKTATAAAAAPPAASTAASTGRVADGAAPNALAAAPADPLAKAAAAAVGRFSITLPGVMVDIGGGGSQTGSAFGPASRLGGPKPKTAAVAAPTSDAHVDFLRAVHAAACNEFGTVLGPEANRTHKNHFHVDMAERPHGAICE
ncbi:MAG TPA: extensin family protein [Hyphomicrobiaceae bacterium]|nr:extensin family protein [Hyphomicrobiaceae bacterium]